MLSHFVSFVSKKMIIQGLFAICLVMNILPIYAHAEYEEPGTLTAADLLKPEVLKGKHHSVSEQVQNDGMFNHYQVTSSFGTFKAPSTTALELLVKELEAIAAMKEIKTDDTAIASLKQSGENTVAGVKHLVTKPEETLKGAASGIESLFHRASETIGSRETTGAEDSKVQQLIGFSKSKGEIATKYGVNVYSRNQVLQDELDRLGWADYLGGLGVGVATSAIPGVGGIVLTTSGTTRLLNEAINTTPASELWVQNRDNLIAMGMDPDTVQLFLNNQVFSPALTTVITSALGSMKDVGNLELFLKVSLQASTPEMARVITEIAVLTAGYHKHIAPLKKVVPMARITRAVGAEDAVIVILPTDYLIWRDPITGLSTTLPEKTGGTEPSDKQLWVSGELSSRTRDELKQAGWQINTNVRSKLILSKE